MKYLDIYKEKINCKNDEDVFQFILSNLKETIRKLDFLSIGGKYLIILMI